MKKINKLLITTLLDSKVIGDEDIELYEYGIIILEKKLIFFCVYFILSIWWGNMLCGMVSLICFIIMRRHMGGLHFINAYLCFGFSLFSLLVCSMMAKYSCIDENIYRLLYFISNSILIVIGPVDCENKRICHDEKKYYYKMGVIILAVLSSLVVVMLLVGWGEIEKAIEGSVILVALTTCIAKLKNG